MIMSKWLDAARLATDRQKGHFRQKVTEVPNLPVPAPSDRLLSPSVPFVPSVTVSKGSSGHSPEDANERILAAIPILLTGRPDHELTAAKQVVMAFLDNHLEAARRIGWSDLELFGCYPDREVARNRYDYAGAVILAAMSGDLIERVTKLAAHYEDGLVYYRKRLMPADAVPVWELGDGS
jgi:hypothetical protein